MTTVKAGQHHDEPVTDAVRAQALERGKDHVLREVVNTLRDVAIEYHATGQLRERLRRALDPLLIDLAARVTDVRKDALNEVFASVSKATATELVRGAYLDARNAALNAIRALIHSPATGRVAPEELLQYFVHSAYPVSTEINPRGHNWCEPYLDQALAAYRASQAIATSPAPQTATPSVPDIAEMVNRFLGWPLPTTFHPDCGVSFKPLGHPNGWPIGTNLLTADEAKAMFLHCLQPAIDRHREQQARSLKRGVENMRSNMLASGMDLGGASPVAVPAAPAHETIVRDGDRLVCTACGTAATTASASGEVQAFADKLIAAQKPLPPDIAAVVSDNAWDLYQSDDIATVDTPELRTLAEFWSGKYHSALPMVRQGHAAAYAALVAHIEALVAGAIAADRTEREGNMLSDEWKGGYSAGFEAAKQLLSAPAAIRQAAIGYESGFFASAPDDLAGQFTLHYESPPEAEAAFLALTDAIEAECERLRRALDPLLGKP